jgi:integrase
MRWENWRDGGYYVTASRWNGIETEPKTASSAAPVPVIPYLASLLRNHRMRLGNPETGPMFPGTSGKPVCLNNVLNRAIKPALKAAGIEWHGWHSFRRGLATNLHDLGVDDKTTQAILRHSDVAVTQACYIKTLPAQSVSAMDALEKSLMGTKCVQQPAKQLN